MNKAQEERHEFLSNMGIFELDGNFCICTPENIPPKYDKVYHSSRAFPHARGVEFGRLGYRFYSKSLIQYIISTDEYKEWRKLNDMLYDSIDNIESQSTTSIDGLTTQEQTALNFMDKWKVYNRRGGSYDTF